jgi:hypothetical protein
VRTERHSGCILRLFDRGHLEEARFVKWFRDAGITVWDETEGGGQFRISDCDGHFGGSLDGVCKGIPDLDPEEPCLVEFKTHGNKSFQQLLIKKVEVAKPEHYAQMNIYMGKMDLKWALYAAINKNTDELYLELISFDKQNYQRHMARAVGIIQAVFPPPKISESPGWWRCRLCSYKEVCHKDRCPEINCRTCYHSTPIAGGMWDCTAHPGYPPETTEQQSVGCGDHIIHPALVPFALIEVNMVYRYIEYRTGKGKTFKQGPGGLLSLACKERNFTEFC